ncbi:MAG: hypothetical protein QM237_06780 [Bacteroidota bacterium]|jgi:hypothetical protein|nr:hypothetical protein [Bacteroidota bacterium]HHU95992.1 hypothetical protein [Petrimonas sp.]
MLNFRFLILSLLFSGVSLFTMGNEDTLRVLFVGNSYTYYNNLPQLVSILSEQTGTKLITQKSVVGGAKLSEHWHGLRDLKTKEMIRTGHYDIVVLQEYSMGAIEQSDSLKLYAKLFCEFIKENGAVPYLYQTWAREKVPQYFETIEKVYAEVAEENDARLVPVGRAWRLANQSRPNIQLFDADGSHPSNLGTFLAACLFTATITGEIPEKNRTNYTCLDIEGESITLMILDKLDVVFCQEIAKDIILKH